MIRWTVTWGQDGSAELVLEGLPAGPSIGRRSVLLHSPDPAARADLARALSMAAAALDAERPACTTQPGCPAHPGMTVAHYVKGGVLDVAMGSPGDD